MVGGIPFLLALVMFGGAVETFGAWVYFGVFGLVIGITVWVIVYVWLTSTERWKFLVAQRVAAGLASKQGVPHVKLTYKEYKQREQAAHGHH